MKSLNSSRFFSIFWTASSISKILSVSLSFGGSARNCDTHFNIFVSVWIPFNSSAKEVHTSSSSYMAKELVYSNMTAVEEKGIKPSQFERGVQATACGARTDELYWVANCFALFRRERSEEWSEQTSINRIYLIQGGNSNWIGSWRYRSAYRECAVYIERSDRSISIAVQMFKSSSTQRLLSVIRTFNLYVS